MVAYPQSSSPLTFQVTASSRFALHETLLDTLPAFSTISQIYIMVSHNSGAMFSGWGIPSSLTLSATTLAAVSILLGSFVFYHQYGHNRNSKSQSLNNELVLITGGCGGIGGQIVEDLARRKARVLVLDIQEPRTETAEGVHFYKVDVNSPQAISEIAKSIRETHGDPTVLINNAGVFCQSTIIEIPEERLRQTFDVNVLSQFFIVKEFLPAMIRRNEGHIITMASIASFVAVGEMVDYCCSKASALAFHEGLTQELKHFYAAPNVLTR